MLTTKYNISDFLEAYQTMIDLIPQLVWLGTSTNQCYEDVHKLDDLAVEAASVTIGANNSVLVLEWLEQAWCVIWSQLLLLRSPLDDLWPVNHTLADCLEDISNMLYSTIQEPLISTKETVQKHHHLAG
ncbi:hypothetical protein FRC11_006802, partial [Ceratobasidium sp. 423]